jgi:hypothetical protein
MQVQINKIFMSRRFGKVLHKGDIVEAPESWGRKIERDGLGTCLEEPKPIKRTYTRKKKKINGQDIETEALEPSNG